MSLFPLPSHLLHLAETALAKGKKLLHRNGRLTFIKAGGVFMQQLNVWGCSKEEGRVASVGEIGRGREQKKEEGGALLIHPQTCDFTCDLTCLT